MIMLLTMGVVDFTRAFFVQETIQQAASDGARRAAVCQLRDTVNNPPATASSIDYAVYRSLFNLDWSNVTLTVAYESGSAAVGRQITVTAAYRYDFITPLAGPIIGGALGASPTLTGKATSTVEQVSPSC